GGDKTSAADRPAERAGYCSGFRRCAGRDEVGRRSPDPDQEHRGDHAAIDRRRYRRGGHGETPRRAEQPQRVVPDDGDAVSNLAAEIPVRRAARFKFVTLSVVPANAGTHSHRQQLFCALVVNLSFMRTMAAAYGFLRSQERLVGERSPRRKRTWAVFTLA